MSGHLVVVGSINTDLVVQASRHPKPGETILGGNFSIFSGGKGANQAVAAARMGARVKMIGAVGDDSFGDTQKAQLAEEGVDVEYVCSMPGVATGVALITVDDAGQNCIVVAPGANGLVTPELISKSEEAFKGASVVLLQLEIPLPAIKAAIRLAKKHGARVVLNPAPALELPADIVESVDDIIPNQSELALLAKEKDYFVSVKSLHSAGARRVIVTLGADGALLSDQDVEPVTYPSFKVEVVDTTAAGDAFVGAYGVAVAEGGSATKALEFGLAAGALAVTKFGAQTSLPTRAAVEDILKTGIRM